MSTIKSFFLGILAAFFALVLELSFMVATGQKIPSLPSASVGLFLFLSAFSEELMKYAVIYKSFFHLKEKTKIIFGGFILGLGFASVELGLIYYSRKATFFSTPQYLLGIMVLHLFTAVFSAYLISKKQNFYFTTARALIFNTLLHILYNTAIIYMT